jgi:hydrogenase nickel incorporation protein HypA/HybF
MHEVAITQSIIDICEKTARHQGAIAVRAVTVEIGELSGVVPEAVEFCFEACSRGTLLEGATLAIRRIPGRGRCNACGEEFPMDSQTFTCPACGEFAPRRISGEELSVKEMEID